MSSSWAFIARDASGGEIDPSQIWVDFGNYANTCMLGRVDKYIVISSVDDDALIPVTWHYADIAAGESYLNLSSQWVGLSEFTYINFIGGGSVTYGDVGSGAGTGAGSGIINFLKNPLVLLAGLYLLFKKTRNKF